MLRTRWRAILAASAATISLAIGVAAVKWYIWDIAIRQAGEPDRSMLFWGLPIVFIGCGALAAGGSLAVFAGRRFTKTEADDPPTPYL